MPNPLSQRFSLNSVRNVSVGVCVCFGNSIPTSQSCVFYLCVCVWVPSWMFTWKLWRSIWHCAEWLIESNKSSTETNKKSLQQTFFGVHCSLCLKHSTTKTSDRFFLNSLRPIRLNGKRDRERKGEEGNLNNEYSSHEASMCPNTISLCVCLRSWI